MKTKKGNVKNRKINWRANKQAEQIKDVVGDFLIQFPEYLENNHPELHKKVKTGMIEYLNRSLEEETLYMKENPKHYFDLYFKELKIYKFDISQDSKNKKTPGSKLCGDVFA